MPPPGRDSEGNVFLDRNPAHFSYILDYLRLNCHKLPDAPTEQAKLEALRAEADYFGLVGLVDCCNKKITKQKIPTLSKSPEYAVVVTKTRVDYLHDGSRIDKNKYTREGYRINRVSACIDRGLHVATIVYEEIHN